MTTVKFLPLGKKGFQATFIEGIGTGMLKKTISEVTVEYTRNVFLTHKTNILIRTDKGFFNELYPTEEDAINETNPIPFEELALDIKTLGDVVCLKEKGLTEIDTIFCDIKEENIKLAYAGFNKDIGFYFGEEDILDKKMFFIKNGFHKLAGKYLEDHVNISSEYQVEKFLESLDIPENIERAKMLVEKGQEVKAYAETSLSKISYISSLKKEQNNLIKKIEKENRTIEVFENMIEKLEELNQKDSVYKKLKILEDLKIIRFS